MFLSEFLTVALVPTLVVNGTSSSEVDHRSSRSYLNSRRLTLPQYPSAEEYFGNDEFFQTKQQRPLEIRHGQQQPTIVKDPVLREIYEEERRLNLAGDGTDTDFDMRSEEARELIRFQRKKMNALANFARQAGAIIGIPPAPPTPSIQGRSLHFGLGDGQPLKNEGQYSTETPTTAKSPTQEEEIHASTIKPATGRMGIGGIFGKVGGAFSSVKQKIFGGGSSNTEAPTAPPTRPSTPSGGNVYFPGDESQNSGGGGGSYYGPPQNSILFEEDGHKKVPNPLSEPLNCTGYQTEYNRACYNVLQQLPCPQGQWLIEDDFTGKGKCVENKCAHDRTKAYFGGKCVTVRAEGDHCHKGMVPYIFKNGEVECDCLDQHLFNARDGNCYPAYQRGPCNRGEIFATKITKDGALPASCMKNKCSKDGYFCNAPSCPNDRNCIALKSKCSTGIWDIHPEKLAPACLDFNIFKPDKIIGNVPTLACAPGSRRDILGTCRKSSRINFS